MFVETDASYTTTRDSTVTVGFVPLTTPSRSETRPAPDPVLNHRNSPLKTSATDRKAAT
jgi:hypothetical protein